MCESRLKKPALLTGENVLKRSSVKQSHSRKFKWSMAAFLYCFSTLLAIEVPQNVALFTHSHTFTLVGRMFPAANVHSHIGVQFLGQGHFDSERAEIWYRNLPITGQPLLPLPQSLLVWKDWKHIGECGRFRSTCKHGPPAVLSKYCSSVFQSQADAQAEVKMSIRSLLL